MKPLDIIERMETIIKTKLQDHAENKEENEDNRKNALQEIFYLLLSFFLDLLKTPFKLMAKFLWKESVNAMKKDAALYAFIMGLMGVLFVFFATLWLFVSVGVGVYFYEKGHTLLTSVFYSVIFQSAGFLVVAFVAWMATRRIRSLKMMKRVSEALK